MATRANIVIYFEDWNNPWEFNKVVTLYRHWDWYPSGLWLDLHQHLLDGKVRGDRDIIHLVCKDPNIQLTDCIHWDIDYLYNIYCGMMLHADDRKKTKLDICHANGKVIYSLEYGHGATWPDFTLHKHKDEVEDETFEKNFE